MITHALYRTSPKGAPFLGTCMRCGRQNFTSADARLVCDAPNPLTDEEALSLLLETAVEKGISE